LAINLKEYKIMKRFNNLIFIMIMIMLCTSFNVQAQQYSSEKNVLKVGWQKGKYSPTITGINKALARADFLRSPKRFIVVEFEPGVYELGNNGILLRDSVIIEAKNCVFNSSSTNGTFYTIQVEAVNAWINGNPTINNTNGDSYKVVTAVNTVLNYENTIYLEDAIYLPIAIKTGNYVATQTDYAILCDASAGAITITLPTAASSVRKVYVIKKIDASVNLVTIDANASELIDGAITYLIRLPYESVTIHCNGSAWYIE